MQSSVAVSLKIMMPESGTRAMSLKRAKEATESMTKRATQRRHSGSEGEPQPERMRKTSSRVRVMPCFLG